LCAGGGGTVIYVVHGQRAPDGFTFVGSFEQDVRVPEGRRERHLTLTVDVYRKN